VQAGSGRPPWLTQPDVFVRGAGAQLLADTAAVVIVGADGATVGAAGDGAGAAGETVAADVQAVNKNRAARVMHASAGVALDRMEVIAIASGRPPSVDRPEGSTSMILTIDGLREAKVRDKDTRLRITLQGRQAARLWRLLGERLTDEEKAAGLT